MQARVDVQDDGKPRIFFKPGALAHEADRALVDAGRPTCALEELVAYVWDPDFLKDEPIADGDHALDNIRYKVRYVNERFPSPQSTAAKNAYSKAPPLKPGVDRVTGLAANLFR